jgi:hypothetical protein
MWDRNLIVKTHFPFLKSDEAEYTVNKAIVVVRNPFEILRSYLNFDLTETHWVEAANNLKEEDPEYLD